MPRLETNNLSGTSSNWSGLAVHKSVHVEVGAAAARGVKRQWSCLLKSCHQQGGVVYNGDADDQDLGTNYEDENRSCDEFENCASTLVKRCGFKWTTAVMAYACDLFHLQMHILVTN